MDVEEHDDIYLYTTWHEYCAVLIQRKFRDKKANSGSEKKEEQN